MLDRPSPTTRLNAWDRDHFFHPSTHMAQHARGETPNRIITGAEGVYIIDRPGQRSLDAFAGLYCVNVGYGRTSITDAIAAQAAALPYYHAYVGHGSEPSIRLAKMIIDRAPKGMSRVFFGLSGSDANETNLKLVWYINNVLGRPEKKKIISRWRGYHGSGLMSGQPDRARRLPQPLRPSAPADPAHGGALLFPAGGPGHGARSILPVLRRQARGDDPRPRGRKLSRPSSASRCSAREASCRRLRLLGEDAGRPARYDVLLIADEVITGFGRLGSMFGSDHYGIEPDLITIAKGLTSAYAPLSGVIVSEKVWRILEQGSDEFGPIGHGWTYSSHPLCAAAGVANLDVVDELGLVDNARDVGAYFRRALLDAVGGIRFVGEVRGEGLMAAVEFVRTGTTASSSTASEKVGPRITAAVLGARRHRAGDAAGRHPRLRAAPLPDPGGGGHRGRRHAPGGARRPGALRAFSGTMVADVSKENARKQRQSKNSIQLKRVLL